MTAITRPGGPIEKDEAQAVRLPLWAMALVFVGCMTAAIHVFG